MKYEPVLNKGRIVLEIVLLLLITLFAIETLWLGYTQQRRANELEWSGVVTQGTVVNKRTSQSTSSDPFSGNTTTTSYYVTYRFEVNGQSVRREVRSAKIYREVTHGEPVTIRYLAQNPSVNEIEGSGERQHKADGAIGIGTIIMIIAIIAGLIRLPAWWKMRG